jgi:hypothetical protein
MIIGKKRREKVKSIRGAPLKKEITRKLGHPGWLKFPTHVQIEIEDQYLQYKNLGLI